MILGIDASNIRSGGGLSHLRGVLGHIDLRQFGFEKGYVWCNPVAAEYFASLRNTDIIIAPQRSLDGSFVKLIAWYQFQLPRLINETGSQIIWAPGGIMFFRCHVPTVMMSQNLLPFEPLETARYGFAAKRIKFFLLRRVQQYAFRHARAVVFLSQYARKQVSRFVPDVEQKSLIISHGVDSSFYYSPRPCDWNGGKPLRLLYISTIDMYKHQWHVVSAVSALIKKGYNIHLDLVGSAYPPALQKLSKTISSLQAGRECIRYRGVITRDEVRQAYHNADMFIFASSCETMSIVLLEAMASGLPIACSNRGPMQELLEDAGVYFDPENPESIAQSIKSLVDQPEMAFRKAQASYELAKHYTWERCANETFTFLGKVAGK